MRAALVIVLIAASSCPASAPSDDDADEGEGEGEGEGEEGEGEGEQDLTPLAFAADHVVEVSVTMDPAAWDALKRERRSVVDILEPGCLDQPFPSPFIEREASVTIDGTTFPRVNIKKRGFLGSLSDTKPGLTIDLDDFEDTQWNSLDKVTLSNSVQDATLVHTCLAYSIFAAAGVPAPRCNFAHVTVNGADLGVYVNIETVRKAFLRRHFANGDGNLYEGTLSDFSTDWDKTFDLESGPSTAAIGQAPEVLALEGALAADDATLMDSLATVIDVDAFMTFWAAEVLIGHWDGYSGNQNNYFLYGDPSSGKSAFIPWGPDQTMLPSITTPFQSVAAQSILTHRLYSHPDGRALYAARFAELLTSAWDEAALHAEIERMTALTAPFMTPDAIAARDAAMPATLSFIDGRRFAITDELAAGPPSWDTPVRAPICFADAGSFDAQFTTTFGTWPTGDTLATGDATLVGTLNGVPFTHAIDGANAPLAGAAAGVDANPPDGSIVDIVSVVTLADGRTFFWFALVPTISFAPATFATDDTTTQVILFEYLPATGASENRGRAYQGTLTLSAASTTPGAAVEGALHVELIQIGF